MPSVPELKMAIAAIVDIAPRMRAEGILRFAFGDISVDLAPPRPDETGVSGADEAPAKPKGMWDDPVTFGRDTDATVPGIRKEK